MIFRKLVLHAYLAAQRHTKFIVLNARFMWKQCLENFSDMNGRNTSIGLKETGDRKFYCLPDEYKTLDNRDQNVSEESLVLLNEIYKNISSRGANFDGPYGRRSVIYCDYAASGQSVNFIEDYIRDHVLPFYGNTHTTITASSLQSTYFRHEAKDIIRKAVNASEHDAVIFTGSGCTSAVNKLIHALNFNLPVVVFVGPYEHHSNLLPWREINAKVIRIKETSCGLVDMQCLEHELKQYSGKGYHLIGSFSAASNVTGIITDVNAVAVLLHKYGAFSFWDYASAGPYMKIDMNPVVMGENEGLAYKDAIFLSPHKFVGGPGTPGILVAKKALFKNPIPCEPGGGTIFFVTRNTHRYLKDIEMREEGGTPAIIGAIRAGMAFQLKEAVCSNVISERESEICRMVLAKWVNIAELKILGSTSVQRLPIFSFVVHHRKSGLYLHHNFICALLNDMFGIQTRSGCACAGPYALDLLGIDETLAQRFDVLLAENSYLDRTHLRRQGEYSEREILRPGFVRLTLPFFMSNQDIEFVLEAVIMVAIHGWKMLPQYLFNPETGEWRHKAQQVFLNRKWLGSISYKTGHFKVSQEQCCNLDIRTQTEILEEARKHFQQAEQVALKKFTPDQQLIFDSDSASIRWFLLPSEAKLYMSGEYKVKIKDPIFSVRNASEQSFENSNENRSFMDVSKVPCDRDENSNICTVITPVHDFQSLEKREEAAANPCKKLCFREKGSLHSDSTKMLMKNAQMCRWHNPPSRIFRLFLKAISEFQMIKNGDRVLACISGGKDSLSLLHTLHQYQFYAKKQDVHFELGAMTVDPKSPLYDPSPLKLYLKGLNVEYFYEEQDIISQAASMDKCTSICSFCSRLKRGRIYACARREGYNVIALGQHLDDLAESFLMSVFHNGRLRTMKAHYTDQSSLLRIIRPFVFVREKDLRKFSEEKKLPVIPENCPACFEAPKERHRMKQLLAAQEIQFPTLYRSLQSAMLPLMSINMTGVEDKLLGKSSRLQLEDITNCSGNEDCFIDD